VVSQPQRAEGAQRTLAPSVWLRLPDLARRGATPAARDCACRIPRPWLRPSTSSRWGATVPRGGGPGSRSADPSLARDRANLKHTWHGAGV